VEQNEEYETSGIRKQGGNMSVVDRRIRGIAQTQSDSLGRWIHNVVKTEDTKVAIYSVYVPSDIDLGGPATVWMQLQHALDRRKDKILKDRGGLTREEMEVTWKEVLYQELNREVRRDIENGLGVVIGGDVNDTL